MDFFLIGYWILALFFVDFSWIIALFISYLAIFPFFMVLTNSLIENKDKINITKMKNKCYALTYPNLSRGRICEVLAPA